MKRIKIATWNIGSMPEKESNREAVLACIAGLDADILCMQEFPEDAELIRRICDAGQYQDYKTLMTSQSHVGLPHRMGIAAFSRMRQEKAEVHSLPIPYESLISFYGRREQLHGKAFMAVWFGDLVLITGHGFPCVRYCSPRFGFRQEMTENWSSYCVSGTEYAVSHEDLDHWAEEIRKACDPLPVIVAADFNVDRQLDYMPECRKHWQDVFEGEVTRPPQYNIGEYKTDAILLPQDCRIAGRENIPGILDHHLLSVTVEL